MEQRYRVIVIGGGHAGVEAAWAAANLLDEPGSVALVTISPAAIGVMSCNPAIGGLAKGQLVREIDALNGLMGLAADASGIQFRVLNTSRGPAVHGPRCQCDKDRYARAVQGLIASRPQIEVIAGVVESLVVEQGRVTGVRIAPPPDRAPLTITSLCAAVREAEGREPAPARAMGRTLLRADAVVLTTGTFMRGLMHTGEERTPGGRYGESPAVGIAASLAELGLEMHRLKTGTPPRLDLRTIDWHALPEQPGDDRPTPFSDLSESGAFPALPQIACRQTRTTPAIHALIRENLHRAPMFSGQITSRGPRYCPSIEDKVHRFDRDEHGVFLEPETLEGHWVYCNGIATSLPRDVQAAVVRGMPGCERAEILRFGYAVEYDAVLPHQILATGMTKPVAGLFLAGQINGTSGYEEAAAQGLVAGVNAAHLVLGRPPWLLGRDEAYIGVLMDDLVTKTPVEPYRMFTSRAEHRLLLRADNAADRLTPTAEGLGLLTGAHGSRRRAHFQERRRSIEALESAIAAGRHAGEPLARWLKRPEFSAEDLALALGGADRAALATVYADHRYADYVDRQRHQIRRQHEMEHRRLPALNFREIPGLRSEAAEALARFAPATFGQAGRLEGITPADLTLLAVHVQRRRDGGGSAA